jgi:hypothetical protein
MTSKAILAILLSFGVIAPTFAQREHTRPKYNTGTELTESQATDVTLTLTPVSVRPIQSWVRLAARVDDSFKVLTGYVYPPEAAQIKVGQRARAFTPEFKSSMYQAFITQVVPQNGRMMIVATMRNVGPKSGAYVLEVVTELGDFLSVPNEAIIEEGEKRVVYYQMHPGHYVPQKIQTGVQGELYTQIMGGLKDGDQVVTFGSFFIDSDYKLKYSGQASGVDHHHH